MTLEAMTKALSVACIALAATLPQAPQAASTGKGGTGGRGDTAALSGNPWFPLDPGRLLILEGVDDGQLDRLEVRVLAETRSVGGIVCRVVEETHLEDGELVEITRCLYAIDPETLDVGFYGEEVDHYRDGVIVGHDGSWEAFLQGAQRGLAMPGEIKPGARWYVAQVPGITADRAEALSGNARVTTPAARFTGCVTTEETSELEPDENTVKSYAPGVGVVQDGHLRLVAHRP